MLKPGEEMTFAPVQLKLAPATAEGLVQTPELRAAPGEYSIGYTVWLGTDPVPVDGAAEVRRATGQGRGVRCRGGSQAVPAVAA